jgi:GTPase SAR1 family protein
LNNIKIIIFVYDITQINSFKQLNEYYDEIIKIKGNKEIIFGVISNKNDLIDQQKISKFDGQKFASSINAIIEETDINKNEIEYLFENLINEYLNKVNEGIIIYKDHICYNGELKRRKKEGNGIMINNDLFIYN